MVLTAAHCFFSSNGTTDDGTPAVPKDNPGSFNLRPGITPRGVPIASYVICCGAKDPADNYNGNPTHGHRVDGHDLAIVYLKQPIETQTYYQLNGRDPTNVQIKDETAAGPAFIVGYGLSGNGNSLEPIPVPPPPGATSPSRAGEFRQAVNYVDWIQEKDHLTTVRAVGQADRAGTNCDSEEGTCEFTPPAGTLLMDFDSDPFTSSTFLQNQGDPEHSYGLFGLPIGGKSLSEGLPARGDSGGPLFEFQLSDTQQNFPILVGVASSASDYLPTSPVDLAFSRFGSIAYYTRVQDFDTWIVGLLEAPEPPPLFVLSIGLAGLGLLRWHWPSRRPAASQPRASAGIRWIL